VKQLGGRKRRISELAVPPGDEAAITEASRIALRSRRGRKAVPEAIAIIKSAAEVPFAEGIHHERETFQRLRAGFEAKALRYLFFAERRAGRAPEGAAAREVAIVGMIGAGLMGCGIAAALALAGLRVLVTDKDQTAAHAAAGRVASLLSDAAGRGQIAPDDATAAAGRVEAVLDLSGSKPCSRTLR
jgi:3-hydroxyacyl-CoA dehydrogenase